MPRRVAVAVVALSTATAVAWAEPSDPPPRAAATPRRPLPPLPPYRPDPSAVAIAAEGNLEWPRAGFRISVAAGPSLQVGFGIDESSGSGLGASLRVGTSVGPRLAWLLEVVSTGYLAENEKVKVKVNNSALVVLGAQVHLANTVWLRGGAGFARFSQPSEMNSPDVGGVGATAGGGIDLVSRGSFVLSAEWCLLGALYGGDGQIVSGFLGVGATSY